jgi:hypothetical protein
LTSPYNLHAIAALWSLAQAWPMLLTARTHAYTTIQAWRPIIQVSGGAGPSSRPPSSDLDHSRASYLDQLYEDGLWSLQQGRWLLLSAGLGCPTTWDGYAKLIGLAPWRTAMDIRLWLASTDDAIRRGLGLLPDLWTLPANPACPHCGVRLLRVQRSAPDSADWTIVCTAGCRCRGVGCPCGMLERVEGVGHIWDRSAPFLAELVSA